MLYFFGYNDCYSLVRYLYSFYVVGILLVKKKMAAEGSFKKFVPKVPANIDQILFAKDLVDCVMRLNSLNYISEKNSFRECAYNAFNKITQTAVCHISNGIKKNNEVTFRKMENGIVASVTKYERLVESLDKLYFSESFDAKLFLFYCVRIAGIASLYYNRGISGAPELARFYIVRVLEKYYMIVGVWRTLHRIAGSLNNMQQVNDLISKYTDSEEIELLNQTQEVRVEEATSSQSEKHVLSENEENNVERQQELPRSIKEMSLMKSAQFSPDSSSEKGLSALKWSDISEEAIRTLISKATKHFAAIQRFGTKDMLKLDSSHIEQEFISIENCQKRIFDLRENEITDVNCQTLRFEGSKWFNKSASDDMFISFQSNACQKFYPQIKFGCCKGNCDLNLNRKNKRVKTVLKKYINAS